MHVELQSRNLFSVFHSFNVETFWTFSCVLVLNYIWYLRSFSLRKPNSWFLGLKWKKLCWNLIVLNCYLEIHFVFTPFNCGTLGAFLYVDQLPWNSHGICQASVLTLWGHLCISANYYIIHVVFLSFSWIFFLYIIKQ